MKSRKLRLGTIFFMKIYDIRKQLRTVGKILLTYLRYETFLMFDV